MSLQAILYTRPGCHLCEDAQADLERLRRRLPHALELVDITASDDLLSRYGERIPVLSIGGREYAAPLSPQTLERALKQAATDAAQAPRAPNTG
jgi:Glutaredoxin-like domain (DUF836)